MHIMVYKRFMRKHHTCFGHEARRNKLLLEKPPCIISADSASIVCEQGANEPSKVVREKEGEGEKYKTTNVKNG